jgi:alkylated DNA repair dioxygenase AlkB
MTEFLIVDGLDIRRDGPSERTQLSPDSWFELSTGFVSNPSTWFDTMYSAVQWEQGEVFRYERYVPEKRLGATVRSADFTLTRQTELHLESRFKVRMSGVSAILYRDGDDHQGLHSDRQLRWLDDTLIAIVVLGERRPFVFRQRSGDASFVDRTPAGSAPGDVVVQPGDGDLLVMGGACQREFLHSVPGADTPRPRISLTWRWTSRCGRPDTNPGYFDGRQFSDRPPQPGTRRSPVSGS